MIHNPNPKDSKRFLLLRSKLFKSMRAGLSSTSIDIAKQLTSPALKACLMVFVCENCPNIEIAKEVITAQPDFVILIPIVEKLCKARKTRIVVNALRIACEDKTTEHLEYVVRYNENDRKLLIFDDVGDGYGGYGGYGYNDRDRDGYNNGGRDGYGDRDCGHDGYNNGDRDCGHDGYNDGDRDGYGYGDRDCGHDGYNDCGHDGYNNGDRDCGRGYDNDDDDSDNDSNDDNNDGFSLQIDLKYTFTKSEQVRLLHNARTLVKSLQTSDRSVVLLNFTRYIPSWIIDAVDHITHGRWLDICLLFLSSISLRYATSNIVRLSVYQNRGINVNEYADDIFAQKQVETVNAHNIKYYLTHLITNPGAFKTHIDIYGENYFIRSPESIENLIKPRIDVKSKQVKNIVSLVRYPFAFCSLSDDVNTFSHIITTDTNKTREQLRSLLLAEYVKKLIGLNALDRVTIRNKNTIQIVQRNYMRELESDKIDRGKYFGKIYDFKPSDVYVIKDDFAQVLGLFKLLAFLYVIGPERWNPLLIIHHEESFYSLSDSMDLVPWLFMFKFPISRTLSDEYKCALKKSFRQVRHWLKSAFRNVRAENTLPPNMKLIILTRLLNLMSFKSWRFTTRNV